MTTPIEISGFFIVKFFYLILCGEFCLEKCITYGENPDKMWKDDEIRTLLVRIKNPDRFHMGQMDFGMWINCG